MEDIPEGVAFFLDMALYYRAAGLLSLSRETEFFPFRQFEGRHPAGHCAVGERTGIEAKYAQMPEVFKRSEIGVTIESLLCAWDYMSSMLERGVPLIGVRTYSSSDQYRGPASFNSAMVDTVFNNLISRYLDHLEQKGFPYSTEQFCGNRMEHNDRVTQVRLRDCISTWYLVDSIPTVREGVKQAMYSFAVAALGAKGVDTSDFRLVRFSRPYLKDDGLSIFYEHTG
jgi:hypothetical protein